MTIADDNQNPRPAKKLAKSLDAMTALRMAMEQRLAAERASVPVAKPEPAPIPVPEMLATAPAAAEPQPRQMPELPPPTNKPESPKASEPPKMDTPTSAHDPAEWSRIMVRIAERSQKLIHDYLAHPQNRPMDVPPIPDPAHLGEAFLELTNKILNDPERFADAQITLWQGYIKVWQTAMARAQGKPAEPIITPAPADKRFQDKDWQNVWLFDFIKQSYLLTANWVQGLVKLETADLDPKLARKLDFYTRQMVDAISPSNFWLTNPEVLRATLESGGENFVKGMENMLNDLERGGGQLRISMSDAGAFKVGENLATTPGKVVYQNDLIQLIQYAPTTSTVHRTPLLIIPPWINKFYILDLNEKKSLVRYLVAEGHTVFCISWVNPDARQALTNFDDYMSEGALAAMRGIKRITGEDKINVTGYCIGGTLLACTQAYIKAQPTPSTDLPAIASATYLVTMVDFNEPGDLGVFIDEDQVRALETRMAKQGYLDAASMATTFNLLRSNDLIWSFVVNNYLLGREPFPFDILYWNMDSTNLPAVMQSFYLRKMYLANKLIEAGGLSMKDVPIDVRSITTPSFLLSTREDHIAPWRSTYAATQLYQGPVKFVLSGSGHIAGIVNPPSAKKYGYWTNDACPAEPEDWLKEAVSHDGSWWPEWANWLKDYAGNQIPAREVASGLEAAPGSYVKVKAI